MGNNAGLVRSHSFDKLKLWTLLTVASVEWSGDTQFLMDEIYTTMASLGLTTLKEAIALAKRVAWIDSIQSLEAEEF